MITLVPKADGQASGCMGEIGNAWASFAGPSTPGSGHVQVETQSKGVLCSAPSHRTTDSGHRRHSRKEGVAIMPRSRSKRQTGNTGKAFGVTWGIELEVGLEPGRDCMTALTLRIAAALCRRVDK